MNAIKGCVAHYSLNLLEHYLSNGHHLIKLQKETSYINKPAFMKNVKHQSERIFEVSDGNTIDLPIYVTVGFLQKVRLEVREIKIASFCKPLVTFAQIIIGNQNCPEVGKILDYTENNCSRSYGETVSCFNYLTKGEISQLLITQWDFWTDFVDDAGDKINSIVYIFLFSIYAIKIYRKLESCKFWSIVLLLDFVVIISWCICLTFFSKYCFHCLP